MGWILALETEQLALMVVCMAIAGTWVTRWLFRRTEENKQEIRERARANKVRIDAHEKDCAIRYEELAEMKADVRHVRAEARRIFTALDDIRKEVSRRSRM